MNWFKRLGIAILTVMAITASDGARAANNPANIPAVSSITALRALPAVQYPNVYLTQYNATTGIGGGEFTLSSACASDDGGVCIQAVGGYYRRNTNGQPFNIAWFGAQCGGQQVTDGVSSVSGGLTNTITSATANWSSKMVGWRVVVTKAATGNNQVDSTIISVTAPGTLTYSATTGAANTGETVSVYPDDTTAINNTVSAAGSLNSVTLPAGATCGFANPGSNTSVTFLGPALYLNGGRLWLGQTGPVTSTGVSWGMNASNQTVVGPGVIDGLYQTNQGVFQTNAWALVLQNAFGVASEDSITNNVVIQNTKGDCLFANQVSDLKITDLTVQNCGDYQYVPPTGNPEQGRTFGASIITWSKALSIKGFTALNSAQSGILIADSVDPNGHAAVSNSYFYGNAYYGLDVEGNAGSIDYSDVSFQGSGAVPSRSFVYGGAIFLNTAVIHGNNITSNNIDANAIVMEDAGGSGDGTDWSLSNFSVKGTAANNAGSIYIQTKNQSPAVSQKYSLENGVYDTLELATTSTNGCVAANPMFQVFKFNNIMATNAYTGGGEDTVFAPTASNGDFFYLLGSNSSLGRTQIQSVGSNNKALYFDFSKVFINGAITFSGNTSSIDSGAISSLPGSNSPGNTSFSCP